MEIEKTDMQTTKQTDGERQTETASDGPSFMILSSVQSSMISKFSAAERIQREETPKRISREG